MRTDGSSGVYARLSCFDDGINPTRMLRLTMEEILMGKHVPIAESLEKIRAVTADDVKRVAQRILAEKVSLVAIGPDVDKLE